MSKKPPGWKKPGYKILIPSAVALNWISPDPFHHRNHHGHNAINLAHPSNSINHGFAHLNHPASVPRPVGPIPNHSPTFSKSSPELAQYLLAVQMKLELVRAFIMIEKQHNLSPTRNMDEDTTAQALMKEPIPFTLRAQQLVRNIIDEEMTIQRLLEDQANNRDELEAVAVVYIDAWRGLREVLEFMMPRALGEIKAAWAEEVMGKALRKYVDELVNVVEHEGENGQEVDGMDVDG
jgi:hypothetical protein